MSTVVLTGEQLAAIARAVGAETPRERELVRLTTEAVLGAAVAVVEVPVQRAEVALANAERIEAAAALALLGGVALEVPS